MPKRSSKATGRVKGRPARTRPRRTKDRGRRKAAPRPRGATGAGGPIGPLQPTPAQVLAALPVRGGLGPRQRPLGVSRVSVLGRRGPVQVNAADHLPGFRWDVPAPEWGRRLVWASISFPWQFWRWYSFELKNNSDHAVHIDGSVDWRWVLTGNPFFFPDPPILMEDSGHFTFETFIPAHGDGFDVGWLVPPKSETFLPEGPAPTPLSRLLNLRVGNVLRLWFGVELTNPTLHASGPLSGHGGWAMGGGPGSMYVEYAYLGPPLPLKDWAEVLVEGVERS